jgi:hypothetical protein
MDKYMKAIESIKRLAEFQEGNEVEAYRIYKMVSNRLRGVEEVAMYDLAISREDFLKIQGICETEMDMWNQKWTEEILNGIK